MGGLGSTRWGYRLYRQTTDDLARLRATDLFRRARPKLGQRVSGSLPCSGTGPIDFEVNATQWPVTLCLSYRRLSGGRLVPQDCELWLLSTEPTFGGQHWWFLCRHCGRRCGVLYLRHGDFFPWACRTCRRLVYPSQTEGRTDRRLRSLKKVLERAGGAYTNEMSGIGLRTPKPKGMHRRTYRRLLAEADRLFIEILASPHGLAKLRRMWG